MNLPVEVTRVYNERFIRLRMYYPHGDRLVRPGDQEMLIADGLIQKDYRFRTDEFGFILPSKKHEHPDLSLFFVGGSTTQCLYVEEDHRFPYVVGTIIEQKSGKTVNSYNVGFGGNNLIHSLDIILNYILSFKPDSIIVMHNLNDLTTLLYKETYWNQHDYRSPIVEVRTVKGADPPPTFVSLTKNMFQYLTPHLYYQTIIKPQLAVDEWADIRGKKELTYSEQAMLSEFENLLRTFISICRCHHVIPVLMTQQNRITREDKVVRERFERMVSIGLVKYDDVRKMYEDFNDKIREVAKDENVLLIDLDREIPKTREYLYDAVHFNDQGSLLASQVIANNIIESEIVQSLKSEASE